MPTYHYPDMPLLAAVWYEGHEPPMAEPPDDDALPCSLSPVKTSDFYTRTAASMGAYNPTHIIRMPVSDRVCENFLNGVQSDAYPATVFEIPPASGHYYVTTWAHQVGAGFSNHHTRVYVARYGTNLQAERPLFRGYI